jgi:hypothetical protein
VLIIGTCGEAGHAAVRADCVAGQPSRPSLPSPVIGTARCILGCRHTVSKTYGPGGDKSSTGIRLWMGSYPRRELNSEYEPGAMTPSRPPKTPVGAQSLLFL